MAQIAREMGARLGCDPDVVDTAGLAHDLGHPPFGHNGEDALDEVAAGLRRLRGQRADAAGADPAGGEGARARTARSRRAQPDPGRARRGRASTRGRAGRGQRKFGVYADDAPVFDWLRAGAPAGERRCLEAQVMDWADDVAYSVHDVEDGIHGGYVALRPLLRDADERAALCADVAAAYSGETADDLGRGAGRAAGRPGARRRWPRYDGSHRRAGRAEARPPASSPDGSSSAAVDATRERVRRRPAPPVRRRPGGAARGSGRSARCSRASRCGT